MNPDQFVFNDGVEHQVIILEIKVTYAFSINPPVIRADKKVCQYEYVIHAVYVSCILIKLNVNEILMDNINYMFCDFSVFYMVLYIPKRLKPR